MITEKRLKELIKQGATIYEAKYNHIEAVDLLKRKLDFISSKHNMVRFEPEKNERWQHHKYFDKLFETKEEAEWELKFGNITRVENLSLPSFEKFKENKYGISFRGKAPECYYTFYYNNELNDICLYDNDCEEYTNAKTATYENYFEMCKEVRKLFLGEEI